MQTVCRVHYHKLTWPSSPPLFSKLSPLSSSLHRTQCACLYPSQLIQPCSRSHQQVMGPSRRRHSTCASRLILHPSLSRLSLSFACLVACWTAQSRLSPFLSLLPTLINFTVDETTAKGMWDQVAARMQAEGNLQLQKQRDRSTAHTIDWTVQTAYTVRGDSQTTTSHNGDRSCRQ